jgi:transposase
LGQAAQEELRRRAVALVGEGRSRTEVAGLLDVSRQSVSEWVRAQRLGGDDALAAGKDRKSTRLNSSHVPYFI